MRCWPGKKAREYAVCILCRYADTVIAHDASEPVFIFFGGHLDGLVGRGIFGGIAKQVDQNLFD